MLAKERAARKRALTVALRRAGLTRQQFAARQGVTYTHLYYVEQGERDSKRLRGAIDAMIREQLGEGAVELAAHLADELAAELSAA